MARTIQILLFAIVIFASIWWLMRKLAEFMIYRQPLLRQIAPNKFEEVTNANISQHYLY